MGKQKREVEDDRKEEAREGGKGRKKRSKDKGGYGRIEEVSLLLDHKHLCMCAFLCLCVYVGDCKSFSKQSLRQAKMEGG